MGESLFNHYFPEVILVAEPRCFYVLYEQTNNVLKNFSTTFEDCVGTYTIESRPGKGKGPVYNKLVTYTDECVNHVGNTLSKEKTKDDFFNRPAVDHHPHSCSFISYDPSDGGWKIQSAHPHIRCKST